ncbi:hypothetical protein D3C76_1095420 [compost metagenome]
MAYRSQNTSRRRSACVLYGDGCLCVFPQGTDWGQILHPVRHDNHDLRRRTYSDVPTHQRSSSARKFPGLYYSGHVQLLRSNHLHDLLPGYS